MIRSREIALRCAASLPKSLLRHRYRHSMRVILMEQYGRTEIDVHGYSRAFLRQLEKCKSDEARRILLGISS
jgi:hypothetical protein